IGHERSLRGRHETSFEGPPFDPSIERLARTDGEALRIERLVSLVRQHQHRCCQRATEAAHEVRNILDAEIRPVVAVAEDEAPIAWVAPDPGRERFLHAAMGDELATVPEAALRVEQDAALAAAPGRRRSIEEVRVVDR